MTPQPDWLLASKLRPPRLRPSLIRRDRLLDSLNIGLAKRLTMICAPAGYGKTTLLAQWRENLLAAGKQVAWMSLDEGDADPALVLAHLAYSLSNRDNSPNPAPTIVSGQSEALQRELARIINNLPSPDRLVLVFDDYHLVRQRQIHDLIMRLIRGVPDSVHIVVTSRMRGIVPTSNLAAHGQLHEIPPEQLCFNLAEIEQLTGVYLKPYALLLLEQRTEGWPVAVQLACDWISGQDDPNSMILEFSSSAGDISLFLTEQIVMELLEGVQNFLIETSILDEVNGDVADAMRGTKDGWTVLGQLDRFSALIVQMPGGGSWFRYHFLLRDYLIGRRQGLGEAKVRQLHLAASTWFESHTMIREAVTHAVLGANVERAADLVERAGAIWVAIRHDAPLLRKLLAALPAHIIDARPRLRVARAFMLLKDGRMREARVEVETVQSQLERMDIEDSDLLLDIAAINASFLEQSDTGVTMDYVRTLKGLLHDGRWSQGPVNEMLCVALMRDGAVKPALEAGREALRVYDEFNALNGSLFIRLHLGLAALYGGQIREATELLHEAEAFAGKRLTMDRSTLGIIRILRGTAHYDRGELSLAWDCGLLALDDIENGECWFAIYHAAYTTLSSILAARGRYAEAMAMLDRGDATAERRNLSRLRMALGFHRLGLKLLKGDGAPPAEPVAAEVYSIVKNNGLSYLEREAAVISLCRLAIHRGELSLASDLAASLSMEAANLGQGRTAIKLLLFQALIEKARGDVEAGARFAKQALIAAAREGHRSIFVEEGRMAASFIDEAMKYLRPSDMDGQVVSLIADILSAQIDPDLMPAQDPGRILRTREREVLAGLSQGLSNKEIARQMSITDDAIKYHLKKIYMKLGVSSRDMAVAVAKSHGMLN